MGVVPKYKVNVDFFEQDSEELWYFLGLLASDGYISDSTIELCLNVRDRHILEFFRDIIQPQKPLYDKPKTRSVKMTIHNKLLAKKIKQIFSMKSNKKHEELIFPNVPKKYLKDFIRGYVDGDGTIGTTKGYHKESVYIGPCLRVLGNETFLKELLEQVRVFIPNKTFSIGKKGTENVRLITYNFSIANKVLSWLYDNNNVCLIRKYEKYLQVTNQS